MNDRPPPISLETLCALGRLCDHPGLGTCDGNCTGCRRRRVLVDYALVPGRGIGRIAAAEGISRERVRQILQEAGEQLLAQGWRPDTDQTYPKEEAA